MAGYVTDTPYPDTFFRELSPAWLNYVAAVNGLAPRAIDDAFTYLELGCGFGTSTVINAAAFPQASFHACDFNPTHVDGGRRYAAVLGVDNVTFHDAPFDRLARRDLPAFDFIALHGVYSWIDASARMAVRGLIDRWLRPGGLVYVSYNTLPGWTHELPLRRLIVELAATEAGNAGAQGEAAATTLAMLQKSDWRYFTANPAAVDAVSAYVRGEGEYLAHEFMNAAWEPFYCVDVADDLAAIGLSLVGSATLVDNHLALVLDGRATTTIGALATERQRQLAIDFARNQRFRRDVFTRGGHADPDAIRSIPVGCATDTDDIGATVRVPRGEIRFGDEFIHDVRRHVADGSWQIGDLVTTLGRAEGRSPRECQDASAIVRNLLFLVAGGALVPHARARRVPAGTLTRLGSPAIAAALADAAARGVRRPVPSSIYGNGVMVEPSEARALLDWSQSTDARGSAARSFPSARRLKVLARLGLVA
ncbi:MAG TPA: methyltransferase regulatory domain-containing protein [Vicinamibacterales bacterium]|nr:methyltransferase regulatory domain-containing protein [Vicinamibacterales bacterium]